MKKSLLSLAVALSVCISASALGQKHLPVQTNTAFSSVPVAAALNNEGQRKAPAKAEEATSDTMNYSISGEPYTSIGLTSAPSNSVYAGAICITAEQATRFAGNKITAVNFYTGTRLGSALANLNYVTKYKVFVTNDLQGERLVEEDFTASRRAMTLQNAPLSEPVVIEAGKEYYIGYQCTTLSSNDYVLVVDGLYHGGSYDGGWVYIYDSSTSSYVWDNIADYYGFNCISVSIAGDSLPVDGAYISDSMIQENANAGEAFDFEILVRNDASNDINNVEITYTFGENAPVSKTYEFSEPLAYGKEEVITVSDVTYPTTGMNIPLRCEITKVNGVDNIISGNGGVDAVINVLPVGAGSAPHMVSEEFTSIWCQWCPLGLSNMEYMVETYPDNFIYVEVHGPLSYYTDPMFDYSFYNLMLAYNTVGYPSSQINRYISCDPRELDTYEYYYQYLTLGLVPYGVTAECDFTSDKTSLIVNTKTKFAFDTDNSSDRYKLSYVITEDNVGPYTQQNGYSGKSYECGGWNTQPAEVSMMYNNVGRYMDGYPGVAKSLPASMASAVEYDGTRTIAIPSSVANVDNINVIVYLMDTSEGKILNACKVKSADMGISAITDVKADNTDAPVEYFNLQGVKVENPSTGIYIRRQGTDVKKVVL